MHLVDALTRMRLVMLGTLSASFKTRAARVMTVLNNTDDVALEARRYVATHLDEQTIAALRRPLNLEKPNFELMQNLFDAGVGQCPTSGMPVFNPAACSPELRTAIWRCYCGVATTVNTKALGRTGEALAELQVQLREHADDDKVPGPATRAQQPARAVEDFEEDSGEDDSSVAGVTPATTYASTEVRDVDTTAPSRLPSAMSYCQVLSKAELKPTDVLLIEWSAEGDGDGGGAPGTTFELAAVCSWADVRRGWLDASRDVDVRSLDRRWWGAPVVRCAADGTTTSLGNPRIVSYSIVRRSDVTEAVLRVGNERNALQLMCLCERPAADVNTFAQELDRRHRAMLATMHGAAVEADLPVGGGCARAARTRATSSAGESGDDWSGSDSGDSWSSSGPTSEGEAPSETMDEEVVVASLAQPAATGPPQCKPVGCPSAQLERRRPAKPCPPKKVSATATTISLRLRVPGTPRAEHVEIEYTRVNPRGKPRRIQVA